jgi:hypothetical protein
VEKHVWFSKYTAKDATIDNKEIPPSSQPFKPRMMSHTELQFWIGKNKSKLKLAISVQRIRTIYKHAADTQNRPGSPESLLAAK